MANERFGDWLKNYQTQRITDDMKLWDELELQIKPVRRQVVFSRVGWLVAVLMIIMTTAGVYALDKIINNQEDEGIDAVTEQGKVTEFYITNLVGGEYELAVTLDTVYADSNRVYVTVSSVGTAPADDPIFLELNPHIILPNGDELPFLRFWDGIGNIRVSGSDRVPLGASFVMDFDANIIETTEDVLPLTIKVEITYSRLNDTSRSEEIFLLGETEFVVEVPFNHGITLMPNQTVTASNIEMRLDKVVIAPSLTRLTMCYIEPAKPENDTRPQNKVWLPSISIMVGDEVIFEAPKLVLLPTDYNTETGCYGYNVTVPLDMYVGDWTVTIDSLSYRVTPPIEVINAEINARGITGLEEYEILDQLIQDVFDLWQEKIEGNWTFTFTVPEA
jgi:hypothetical protein